MMAHRVYLYCGPQQYAIADANLPAVEEAAVEVAVEILACGIGQAAAAGNRSETSCLILDRHAGTRWRQQAAATTKRNAAQSWRQIKQATASKY
jgi:hypothetical protein